MERLTQWIDENAAIPRVDLRRCGHERCTTQLARYEDACLTPEKIMGLKERDTEYFCKISIFDRESVVCKCGNDIEKDSGFKFCPKCGQRLKREE